MGDTSDLMTDEEKAKFGAALEKSAESSEECPPKLDDAALYGVAGDIVRAIEPHTEADPVALLVQILIAFGSAAGRSSFYQVEADRHFPNLYAALIGRSSKARKGTSKGHAMMPFRTVDESWTKTCIQSGLSSGEGAIWAVRDATAKNEPVKEKGGKIVSYQKVVTDEGIADKRLLIIESELSSVLRVLNRDGNTLSAVLRNAWDTGHLRVMTKNSPAVATDAHVSIIGHITEDELRRYLDSTEAANGFANRFLWVYVQRSKFLPEGGQIENVIFSPLVKRLGEALSFARCGDRFRFDETAKKNVARSLSRFKRGTFRSIWCRDIARRGAGRSTCPCLCPTRWFKGYWSATPSGGPGIVGILRSVGPLRIRRCPR